MKTQKANERACPACAADHSRVLQSRGNERRRECRDCECRFTTVEATLPTRLETVKDKTLA